MTPVFQTATPGDRAAIEALFAACYPSLLAPAYPAETLDRALPNLVRAQETLLASGRYLLVRDAAGRAVAAGGVTPEAPGTGALVPGRAHVRHVATHPDRTREGIGRALLARLAEMARADGAARLEALSTLNAVPFYAACGFRTEARVDLALARDLRFPAVRMVRPL